MPNITFPSDKELVKKGRIEHVESETKIDGVDIRAVKWADNRCVSLVLSFSCVYPLQEVERYDKKQKRTVTISYPHIVKIYNQFMGGVDLMEAVIALHRIYTRSKKYYHKLIFHFLDFVIVNSWLLFSRDLNGLGVPNKKQMSLQVFKMSVCKALLLEGKTRFVWMEFSTFQKLKRKEGDTKPLDAMESQCFRDVNLYLTKSRNCFKDFDSKYSSVLCICLITT